MVEILINSQKTKNKKTKHSVPESGYSSVNKLKQIVDLSVLVVISCLVILILNTLLPNGDFMYYQL